MGMSKLLTGDSLAYYLTNEPVMVRPTGWELSLHTGDPGIDGTANEVGDTAYERQSITFEPMTTALGDPYAQNDAMISFPTADSGYTVTHMVVWDNNGNVLVIQSLRVPKTIAPSEQAQIAPGEFKIGDIA